MKKYLALAILVLILVPNIVVLAQPPQQGLNEFLNETQLSNTDLVVVVSRIVRLVLTFLGLIAVILIVIGGFRWMTSGGNEDTIKKAKGLMVNGVVGLVIVVLAYAISTFVINSINQIVNG